MIQLTVKQYEDAIVNVLSKEQINALVALNHFPNSTANAIDLAKVLNLSHHVQASNLIGKTGKAIATYLDLNVDDYYFPYKLIGPYSAGEGSVRSNQRGWELLENIRIALANLGLITPLSNHIIESPLSEKAETEMDEGTPYKITQTKYERNATAREICLSHYGYSCCICSFNFEEFYGDVGKGFIHVHHLVALSEIKNTYCVNPINDLRPVCPNCHAMLHTNPPLTIEQLKLKLRQ